MISFEAFIVMLSVVILSVIMLSASMAKRER
jgi:hypothetical protein